MLDFLPKESRTVISGVSLHLRLPIEHAQKAELIKNGSGDVTGIRRTLPLAAVDIELPGVIVTYDSEAGISIALPDDAVLTAPPPASCRLAGSQRNPQCSYTPRATRSGSATRAS